MNDKFGLSAIVILREFVSDVDAIKPKYADDQLFEETVGWSDLFITYRKAKAFLLEKES